MKFSSAYHPKTDGRFEVLNRTVESYLRCFSSEQPKSWSKWLCWAEYRYNITFHSAAGKTPFEIVCGRASLTLLNFLPGETRVELMANTVADQNEILRQLKFHLLRAQ